MPQVAPNANVTYPLKIRTAVANGAEVSIVFNLSTDRYTPPTAAEEAALRKAVVQQNNGAYAAAVS